MKIDLYFQSYDGRIQKIFAEMEKVYIKSDCMTDQLVHDLRTKARFSGYFPLSDLIGSEAMECRSCGILMSPLEPSDTCGCCNNCWKKSPCNEEQSHPQICKWKKPNEA